MCNLHNQEIVTEGLERITQSAKFLGVSRSFVYRLINEGVLPSVKIGKSRRVPIKAVRELAASCLVVPDAVMPE